MPKAYWIARVTVTDPDRYKLYADAAPIAFKKYGATALAWIKLGDELSSSVLKALGHDTVVDLAGIAGAQKGTQC